MYIACCDIGLQAPIRISGTHTLRQAWFAVFGGGGQQELAECGRNGRNQAHARMGGAGRMRQKWPKSLKRKAHVRRT